MSFDAEIVLATYYFKRSLGKMSSNGFQWIGGGFVGNRSAEMKSGYLGTVCNLVMCNGPRRANS